MQIRPHEHRHIVSMAHTMGDDVALHAHGVWTRRIHAGGMEHEKPEYLHIFATDDPDRFLVHLVDGDHWSHETRASVDEMREAFAERT